MSRALTFTCELRPQLVGLFLRPLSGGLQRARALLRALHGTIKLDIGLELLRLQVLKLARPGVDLGEQRLHELGGGFG
jgi:hypothetical protein